jgi:threonine synthase
MSVHHTLACIRFGTPAAGDMPGVPCAACLERGEAVNLTTVYDLERAHDELALALAGDVRGPARYAAVLPVEAEDLTYSDGGPTPLVAAPRLAAAVGLERLWIKDESRGPTWSFKDRAAAIAAAYARRHGYTTLVAASTGNAAAATAAHARRAGLDAVILFAANVDPLMSAFVRSYGARVVVAPSREHRWELMRQGVEELGWYPNSNYCDPPIGNTPVAVDGYKPIAYEIWEQLGRRLPEWVYVSACYGDGLYGIWKGLHELCEMRFTDRMPRLGAGEIYGSLGDALSDGATSVARAPVDGPTLAFSISSPQSTYQALHALRESRGIVSRISDAQLLAAQRLAVECEGMLLETASAVALAALCRDRREGRVEAGEEVVLVSSSAGMKSLGVADFDHELPLVHDFQELRAAVAPVDDRSTT